jgi:hypothetical protein
MLRRVLKEAVNTADKQRAANPEHYRNYPLASHVMRILELYATDPLCAAPPLRSHVRKFPKVRPA